MLAAVPIYVELRYRSGKLWPLKGLLLKSELWSFEITAVVNVRMDIDGCLNF